MCVLCACLFSKGYVNVVTENDPLITCCTFLYHVYAISELL